MKDNVIDFIGILNLLQALCMAQVLSKRNADCLAKELAQCYEVGENLLLLASQFM